jgi:hypothetical protein
MCVCFFRAWSLFFERWVNVNVKQIMQPVNNYASNAHIKASIFTRNSPLRLLNFAQNSDVWKYCTKNSSSWRFLKRISVVLASFVASDRRKDGQTDEAILMDALQGCGRKKLWICGCDTFVWWVYKILHVSLHRTAMLSSVSGFHYLELRVRLGFLETKWLSQ